MKAGFNFTFHYSEDISDEPERKYWIIFRYNEQDSNTNISYSNIL